MLQLKKYNKCFFNYIRIKCKRILTIIVSFIMLNKNITLKFSDFVQYFFTGLISLFAYQQYQEKLYYMMQLKEMDVKINNIILTQNKMISMISDFSNNTNKVFVEVEKTTSVGMENELWLNFNNLIISALAIGLACYIMAPAVGAFVNLTGNLINSYTKPIVNYLDSYGYISYFWKTTDSSNIMPESNNNTSTSLIPYKDLSLTNKSNSIIKLNETCDLPNPCDSVMVQSNDGYNFILSKNSSGSIDIKLSPVDEQLRLQLIENRMNECVKIFDNTSPKELGELKASIDSLNSSLDSLKSAYLDNAFSKLIEFDDLNNSASQAIVEHSQTILDISKAVSDSGMG